MSISAETRTEVQEILRKVVRRAIPVTWRSTERMGAGERKSQYRGKGDDYDGVVEYTPGDDTRDIDWQAYAMSDGNDLLVHVFRQTSDIKAYVLVDVSPSMNFGTSRVTKRRLAAELATSCVASLDKTKDRVGVMAFSANGLERIIKPSIASLRSMFLTAATVVGTQQKEGTGSGLAKAIKRLPKSKSLVFIVSDFMNMTDEDWLALNRAAKFHDIIAMYVQDVRERELPDVRWGWGPIGWLTGVMGCFYTLQDWSGARRTIWVSKKTRALYAANFRAHEAGIKAKLKEARCRSVVVSTEEAHSNRGGILTPGFRSSRCRVHAGLRRLRAARPRTGGAGESRPAKVRRWQGHRRREFPASLRVPAWGHHPRAGRDRQRSRRDHQR
jgi:uncharacterized protein (DUF58 family)